MTASDWRKVLNQIQNKPAKKARFIKHNKPKQPKFGIGARRCKICLRYGAHIRRYDLGVCRQCFRDIAAKIGFKKYG